MNGVKNVPINEKLPANAIIGWYGGRKSDAATNPPNNNVTYGCHRDYLTYSSNVFTVIKAFSGTVKLVGGGTRNGNAGTTGSYPSTLKLYINDTQKISSSVTYTGSGTPDAIDYDFQVGDTIKVTEYHATNSYSAAIYCFIMIK